MSSLNRLKTSREASRFVFPRLKSFRAPASKVFADTIRFEAISRPDHEVPGHRVEVISAYDGLELEL